MNIFKSSSKEAKLWQWFSKNFADINIEDPNESLYAEFHKKLSAIHSSLVFEISREDKTGIHTLVISCDGIKEGIPAVNSLVSKAPPIDGWDITAFRQPVDDNLTIEMGDLKLSTEDVLFDCRTAPNNMFDITLYIDGLNDANKDQYLQAAFVLLDAAIGEYTAMTRMRYIDLLPMSDVAKTLQPLGKLSSSIK